MDTDILAEPPSHPYKLVRDPVHDYVKVPKELLRLVRSPRVQRLRHISQTAMATSVYPSLTGTRYEHALGTMHLAIRAWDEAWGRAANDTKRKFIQEIQDDLQKHRSELDPRSANLLGVTVDNIADLKEPATQIRHALGVVGLTHDIGHPPFSHALEHFCEKHAQTIFGGSTFDNWSAYQREVRSGKPQFHEFAGKSILDAVLADKALRLPTYLIKRIYAARGEAPFDWAACLHGLIDGEFDVDRLDYLARDAGRAGMEFSAFDSSRLLDSLELHYTSDWRWVFGLGLRARSAMETFLFQRAQSYLWMIFHSGVVASNAFLERAVEELWRLGTGSESAVRTAFVNIRPALDYVSSDGGAPSHMVDDHSIYTWLKLGSAKAHELRQSGEGDPTELTMVQVLCEESLYHEPRYVPLWRTFDEQVEACKNFGNDALSIARFGRLLGSGPAAEALQAYQPVGETGQAVGFNALVESHRNSIDGLEQLLNQQFPSIKGLGPGRWVLSFTNLHPYSAEDPDPDSARSTFNHLFDGNRPVSLLAVSPMVRQLAGICIERIKLHVFYLLATDMRIDEGRRKGHSRRLREPFAKVFLEWIDSRAEGQKAA